MKNRSQISRLKGNLKSHPFSLSPKPGTPWVAALAALAAGRFWNRILYGVQTSDPVTLAIVLLLMLSIGSLGQSVLIRSPR